MLANITAGYRDADSPADIDKIRIDDAIKDGTAFPTPTNNASAKKDVQMP